MNDYQDRSYLSVVEVATHTGLSVPEIHRLIRTGALPASKSASGQFRLDLRDIAAWQRSKPDAAPALMWRRSGQRSPCVAGVQPAAVIAYDEMWTCQKARRQGKRRELWVWTAVVEETDGRRWADFEVGSRGAETLLRW